ncbi:hypothetical protein P0Y35_11690 [Kiritimatiellaeota bacterium B1221]|nr:hypothetical protein [Kiritimatiellaeota bacterium B1221]
MKKEDLVKVEYDILRYVESYGFALSAGPNGYKKKRKKVSLYVSKAEAESYREMLIERYAKSKNYKQKKGKYKYADFENLTFTTLTDSDFNDYLLKEKEKALRIEEYQKLCEDLKREEEAYLA